MKRKTDKNRQAEPTSQIELRGNTEVVVDGCRCIIEYEPETIKLDIGKLNVRINGSRLTLKGLSLGSVLIAGFVTSVEFEDRAVKV